MSNISAFCYENLKKKKLSRHISARLRMLLEAAFTRTRVGKLKLVCVNVTKAEGKHVDNLLATNRTCLYSHHLFKQFFSCW